MTSLNIHQTAHYQDHQINNVLAKILIYSNSDKVKIGDKGGFGGAELVIEVAMPLMSHLTYNSDIACTTKTSIGNGSGPNKEIARNTGVSTSWWFNIRIINTVLSCSCATQTPHALFCLHVLVRLTHIT